MTIEIISGIIFVVLIALGLFKGFTERRISQGLLSITKTQDKINQKQDELNNATIKSEELQTQINKNFYNCIDLMNKKLQDLTARVEILEKGMGDVKLNKEGMFDLFDRVWALEKKLEEKSDE